MVISTGQSRQFAFAQFVGIPEARRFLETYYPYISLFGAHNLSRSEDTEGPKVRLAFSRDKDDRDKPGKNGDDWKCEVVWSIKRFLVLQLIRSSVILQTTPIGFCVSDAMHHELVMS